MRSANEILFRLRQEIANIYLFAAAPSNHEASLDPSRLPDAREVAGRLAQTPFASDVLEIADNVVRGRIPIGGTILDVSGAPIDWRRDYRHDISSPPMYFRRIPYLDFQRVGDHKVIWDLNRHQHLVVLAQAFLFTSKRDYLEAIEMQLASWFEANPYQAGINWTSALEVAFRALSWTWLLHLVGSHLTPALHRQMVDGLYKHGHHLEYNLSVYFSPNTHLLGEAVVLHALGVLFPGFPSSARWTAHAKTVVEQQMVAQVRDDGSHFEESAYYHVYALDFFLLHAVLADTSTEYRSRLWRMADYLQALMGPSRRLPRIGDDDGGRVFHPYGNGDDFGRATLATAAILLKEEAWAFDEHDTYSQAAWWLGPSALDRTQPLPALPSRVFEPSGTVIMNGPAAQVVFDAGTFGRGSGGHSHSDALSIVVRTVREDVLIDPGTFTYVSDPELRRWFRGSAAHNTVRVDGHDQAVNAGPFRWSGMCDTRLVAWHGEARRDRATAVCRYRLDGTAVIEHRRDVSLVKDDDRGTALLVSDEITGAAGEHLVEQFWHPGAVVVRCAPNRARIGEGAELLVEDRCTLETLEGWRSRAFGEKTSSPVLVVRRRGPLPVRLWTCVWFGRLGTGPVSLTRGENAVKLNLGDGRLVSYPLQPGYDKSAL